MNPHRCSLCGNTAKAFAPVTTNTKVCPRCADLIRDRVDNLSRGVLYAAPPLLPDMQVTFS